jgi:hypothetical protein
MATKTKVSDRLADGPPEEEKSIVEMMEETRRRRFREAAMKLRGKLHLDIDIDEIRGRNRN